MKIDLDILGIKKRQMRDAVKKISDAFDKDNISVKEFVLAQPILIIAVFNMLKINKDKEKQSEFFKDLENAVYETLKKKGDII
jgi:hypothetical protein